MEVALVTNGASTGGSLRISWKGITESTILLSLRTSLVKLNKHCLLKSVF